MRVRTGRCCVGRRRRDALAIIGSRPDSKRSGHTRGQSGVVLLDILLAVVFLSLVIAALAGGFLTVLGITNLTSQKQATDAALTSFTESLKTVPYQPCGATPAPTVANYQRVYDGTMRWDTRPTWTGKWTPTSDAGVTDYRLTGTVEYWDPTAGTVGAFVASCPAVDGGAERLNVTVTVAGSTATGMVVIRKSDA